MRRLTVLYDAECSFCVRCKDWLARQPAFVELAFLPCRSPLALKRYGQVPWLIRELVVVSDEGEVWAGPAAFLVCMWALRDWRERSYGLFARAAAALARRRHHSCQDGGCPHPYR